MRLIDADAFENYVFNEWQRNEISNGDWITFREWLKDQEIIVEFDDAITKVIVRGVEYKERKEGKNIYNTVHGHCEFKCSLCGAEAHIVEGGELDGGYFNFCPNCGAEMEPERKPNGLV